MTAHSSVDEIKTIILLTGNKRIPQLEAEIFADAELTEFYIRQVCNSYSWYDEYDWVVECIYYYSRNVIGGRWPEAEHLFLQNPAWAANYFIVSRFAANYAIDILKGRWIEAEPMIYKDWVAWKYYTQFLARLSELI